MKVIRARVGVLGASFGLLAGVLGLTALAVSSAMAGAVTVATGSASAVCPRATVIEAGAGK
jgi:hypothetical protein